MGLIEELGMGVYDFSDHIMSGYGGEDYMKR